MSYVTHLHTIVKYCQPNRTSNRLIFAMAQCINDSLSQRLIGDRQSLLAYQSFHLARQRQMLETKLHSFVQHPKGIAFNATLINKNLLCRTCKPCHSQQTLWIIDICAISVQDKSRICQLPITHQIHTAQSILYIIGICDLWQTTFFNTDTHRTQNFFLIQIRNFKICIQLRFPSSQRLIAIR